MQEITPCRCRASSHRCVVRHAHAQSVWICSRLRKLYLCRLRQKRALGKLGLHRKAIQDRFTSLPLRSVQSGSLIRTYGRALLATLVIFQPKTATLKGLTPESSPHHCINGNDDYRATGPTTQG